MSNVTVIGVQWGDEGKGKVVDWLSHHAEAVIRFQGGHNAGHTLVVDGKVFKLSLLPSGVVRSKFVVIGNGVVIDADALLDEIETVRQSGIKISPETLRIADNATLILPFHVTLDRAKEDTLGTNRIGTTQRGIGPAYEDKVGRRSIRLADLNNDRSISQKLDILLAHHNPLLAAAGFDTFRKEPLLDYLVSLRPRLMPYVEPVWLGLRRLSQQRAPLLFEGAQAVMLDLDHGTYPFVTSSSTVAAAAAIGTGLGPMDVGTVVGVAKAYTTRVGNGPFPTEITDDVGEKLRVRGGEYGTVTGRPRRCGWFDAVQVRQACMVGGIDGLVISKLDVLDGLSTVRICTKYELDGEIITHLPAALHLQAKLIPHYERLDGWLNNTKGVRALFDLPQNAIKFLRRLEELVGVPIILISTGAERNDLIILQNPFERG